MGSLAPASVSHPHMGSLCATTLGVWCQVPTKKFLDQAYNPSIQKSGDRRVGQPWIHIEFKASLGYIGATHSPHSIAVASHGAEAGLAQPRGPSATSAFARSRTVSPRPHSACSAPAFLWRQEQGHEAKREELEPPVRWLEQGHQVGSGVLAQIPGTAC